MLGTHSTVHMLRRFRCQSFCTRRSTLRRLVLNACCSTLRCSTLRCSMLRHSVLRTTALQSLDIMSFHLCITCQVKLPASDPHEDCVVFLCPDHATYCTLCAWFQTPHPAPEGKEGGQWSLVLLWVIPHSFCSTVIHNDSASEAAALWEPILPTHSWSDVPDQMCSGMLPSPSTHRVMFSFPSLGQAIQGSLTSKMSKFMEVMIGQQSLLISLTEVAPPVSGQLTGPTGQPVALPQPIPIPAPQLYQAWNVDAISRDASDKEPLLC